MMPEDERYFPDDEDGAPWDCDGQWPLDEELGSESEADDDEE